jgi:hypothetical protein
MINEENGNNIYSLFLLEILFCPWVYIPLYCELLFEELGAVLMILFETQKPCSCDIPCEGYARLKTQTLGLLSSHESFLLGVNWGKWKFPVQED